MKVFKGILHCSHLHLRRPEAQYSKKKNLRDIMCGPMQMALLQHLSAYDIAKLGLVLHLELRDTERKRYLNPIRDLVWNIPEIEFLLAEGMKLLLFGDDVPDLSQRLQDTKKYLDRRRGNQRLQIYLVGSFPIQGKSTTTLERMIKFSIDGGFSSGSRIFKDKVHVRKLKVMFWENSPESNISFLMAFGAPTNLHEGEAKGFWYKVSNVPDQTIDLRVYVPSLQDRVVKQVKIPALQIPRITGCLSGRACVINVVASLCKICAGRYTFADIVSLGVSGCQPIESTAQESVLVHFSPSLATSRISY